MEKWLSQQLRLTVQALVFPAAGGVLTLFSPWLAWEVLQAPWPVSLAGARLHMIGVAHYAVLRLLGLLLTGLNRTVALRQASARFVGADFSASGGDGGGDSA